MLLYLVIIYNYSSAERSEALECKLACALLSNSQAGGLFENVWLGRRFMYTSKASLRSAKHVL